MAGTKLLACPFCGGEAEAVHEINGFWTVECVKCGALVDGIEAWNTRYDQQLDAIPATEENMARYGWVRERTCHDYNESAREHGAHLFMWRCSNCDESYDTEMDKLNYCPNCGARVTPKDSETTPRVVSE